MVVSFADILLLVIVFFGVIGSFRGIRAAALTSGAIFFALVVVIFAGDPVMAAFRRLGVALSTPDTQALFDAGLFVFTAFMASRVLAHMAAVPTHALTRSEKLWGLVLGLLNGFFVMAIVEHYLSGIIQATPGRSSVSVGVPALSFSHPAPDVWTVSLVPSTFTLLPPGPDAELWAKLPLALVLLLLFLAFVFVGTVYGRVSRSRS